MGYKTVSYGKRASRRNYSKMLYDIDLPNLIEIQTSSFKQFVDEFIGELLQDVSPIEGHNGDLKLYFVDYYLEKPKHSISQAKMYDVSYTRQLFANVKLENAVTGEIREAQVRLAELPYMTPTGTFIINGAERVIVSQIIRSAGVYFTAEPDLRLHTPKYSGQIIPTRGAWVEFELGSKNLFYGKLDRSKKIFLTTLIKALGFNNPKDITKYYSKALLNETLEKDDTKNSDEAVVELYAKLRQGESVPANAAKEYIRSRLFDRRRYDLASVGRFKYNTKLSLFERIVGNYTSNEITLPTGEVIPKETFIDFDLVKKLKEHRHIFRKEIISVEDSLQNDPVEDIFAEFDVETGEVLYTKSNIINNRTGEILASKNTVVDEELINLLRKNRSALDDKVVKYFLLQDPYEVQKNREGVVVEYMEVIHKNPQTNKSTVVKVLGNDPLETKEHITVSDIAAGISYYLNLFEGLGTTDDIDHLGNRRLRLIGELLQNQFRVGLARTEKNIKDRMSTTTFNDATISSIINTTPLSSAINSFFGSSQLSQFMDQINPLAELTQKRRVSALGVGGLSRDRAGIEVRDVHNSHYGRICPIETPEGQSIGLISSLASYSKVDQYGFIQTPYLVVDRSGIKNGEVIPRVTDEYVFLTASEEEREFIASAATPLDENGFFLEDRVVGRLNGETTIVDASQVSYMDVSPKQIVSVATATIPFLEHDEASRALMGANMQRQAVPLMTPESPIVGTGVEYRAAKDSGATVICQTGGFVTYVDSNVIKITEMPFQRVEYDGEVLFDFGKEFTFENALKLSENNLTTEGIYELIKFDRSNQNTCIIQTPLVSYGDWVDAGEVIADGPSTDKGELALGRNVTVAFMMWEGYNYEDAIIMCEDLVKHDVYTSVHIEEYEIFNRELKAGQGKEEITREIPFVSAEAVRNLDENGIVIVGSEVKEGDILVGKITPKGSSDPQPAEKLIQAIIGEKSREYRDTSLKVQHGGGGVVQKVLHFKKGKKNLPEGITLPTGVNEQIKVFVAKKRKISEGDKMAGRHGNKGVISKILPREDMPYMADGTPIDIMLNPLGVPSRMNIGQILEIHLGQAAKNLNVKIAAPVFDGVNDTELANIMKEGGVSPDGKMILYDGRTGEPYANPISVGVMYMIKLSHMVDDKLHARNVGPYTLVTQQPMGGKAQNGGQRFGEMEVWALYAYGAAHTLQELLTVKSDDMTGRNKVYSAITYGREIPKASLPESFRVLTHELQALGLYVELINSETGENDAVKSLVRPDQRFRGGFR